MPLTAPEREAQRHARRTALRNSYRPGKRNPLLQRLATCVVTAPIAKVELPKPAQRATVHSPGPVCWKRCDVPVKGGGFVRQLLRGLVFGTGRSLKVSGASK